MGTSAIAKYIEKLHEISNSSGNLIFRGVPNSSLTMESSTARKLKENNKSDLIQYHKNMIESARKNHSFNSICNFSDLHDLEVLAEIQHQGGDTCLTDFTTNFLISLWFASTKSTENANGKIFIIDVDSPENEDKLSIYTIKKDENETIDTLLTSPQRYIDLSKNNEPVIWVWEPSRLNGRIIKQDTVYLFGLPVIKENSIFTLKPIEIELTTKMIYIGN